MSELMSGRMSETMSDLISDLISKSISESIAESISESIAESISESISEIFPAIVPRFACPALFVMKKMHLRQRRVANIANGFRRSRHSSSIGFHALRGRRGCGSSCFAAKDDSSSVGLLDDRIGLPGFSTGRVSALATR